MCCPGVSKFVQLFKRCSLTSRSWKSLNRLYRHRAAITPARFIFRGVWLAAGYHPARNIIAGEKVRGECLRVLFLFGTARWVWPERKMIWRTARGLAMGGQGDYSPRWSNTLYFVICFLVSSFFCTRQPHIMDNLIAFSGLCCDRILPPMPVIFPWDPSLVKVIYPAPLVCK